MLGRTLCPDHPARSLSLSWTQCPTPPGQCPSRSCWLQVQFLVDRWRPGSWGPGRRRPCPPHRCRLGHGLLLSPLVDWPLQGQLPLCPSALIFSYWSAVGAGRLSSAWPPPPGRQSGQRGLARSCLSCCSPWTPSWCPGGRGQLLSLTSQEAPRGPHQLD